ncbi:hypothetical protein [Flavobacterium wongokense]|uniref:hypothetical protein n=1 Tax=Flavobacterium wongokense TaxID=2910674 RepID=UPI001F1D04FF|nr:hypothetical protein [Flavobacterium sp. WG47]MCF6130736.1 hypothetical protein [Flavobacterium sp. WG47]
MNATKLIGALLIIVAIMAGYIGLNKIADSTKEINFLGLKINASDESGKQEGFMYVGAAILLFAGGIYTMRAKKP